MRGRLQTDNASDNELVRQFHQWRISKGYGRGKAVEVFKEKVGFSVSYRTLEKWEQGVSNPSNSAEFLLTQFLEKIKKEK
tara:strand:+ start:291 stop:530 length:240 start_codon:yes stop_codon:yes gene_type:complete